MVDEVRPLSRPRGVDHLSSLVNKGAFNSVLAVMDPTEEAALTVLDIVSSCVEVSILAVQALDESVARWVFRMRALGKICSASDSENCAVPFHGR